jgi:AcrR family transcriptional regulator
MSSEPSTKARILDAAQACAAANRLTMAAVAAQAGLSRQAVYLHFPDRAALLGGLARRLDLPQDPAALAAAPSARAALTALVARLAGDYPQARPVARLLDGQANWQESRLATCRLIAARFQDEGTLSRHLSLEAASDLLWSLTSLAVWEDLVIGRGWTHDRYRSHVSYLAVSAVTK